jgi:hypothetical protein
MHTAPSAKKKSRDEAQFPHHSSTSIKGFWPQGQEKSAVFFVFFKKGLLPDRPAFVLAPRFGIM